MAIQVVKEEEKLTMVWEDSKIYYRRIPTPVQNRIITRNTKKGKQNWEKVNEAFLKYCVLGWDNVQDEGTPVDFQEALVTALPGEIVDALLEEAVSAGDDVRKNSKTSSSLK